MSQQIERGTWRAEAERQGIGLGELAKRTGVSRRAIYAYSIGDRQPSDEWIVRVAAVLTAMDAARAVDPEATA